MKKNSADKSKKPTEQKTAKKQKPKTKLTIDKGDLTKIKGGGVSTEVD